MWVFGSAAAALSERFARAIQPLAVALDSVLARPELEASINKAVRALRSMHARIEAIEAPGYQPYFEQLGQNEVMARFHAGVVRHIARRLQVEDRNKRVAVSVIHDLAKRRRWHPAFQRQVARLCDAFPNGGVMMRSARPAVPTSRRRSTFSSSAPATAITL